MLGTAQLCGGGENQFVSDELAILRPYSKMTNEKIDDCFESVGQFAKFKYITLVSKSQSSLKSVDNGESVGGCFTY